MSQDSDRTTDDEGSSAASYIHRPDGPPEAAGGALTDRQQWLFVGLLVVLLVGFPVAILVWPPTILSFRDAFLGLAMLPGVALGVAAVWLALGGRRSN
ncbi:MAG: hypothetical protein ABEJ35_05820 [Halobacteriaceae archaeon]